MQPFTYDRPASPAEAVAQLAQPQAEVLAGGTDLMQLMKEGQHAPRHLVDITGLPWRGVTVTPDGIQIGALTHMAEAAEDPSLRKGWPMVAEALLASASPQIRNQATMGGNVLQRTRCLYFRDAAMPCNKRQPGSGCPAYDGQNRNNAILGGSDQCIATHASDLAVALVALDARIALVGPTGSRDLAFADFHLLPGNTPQVETVLRPGELIASLFIPNSAAAQRSRYVKLRDRASFEWALVSAAVGLEMDHGTIGNARVAVGGVATKPWRLPRVEAALAGAPLNQDTLRRAAALAANDAQPRPLNGFKVELLRRVVFRALAVTGGVA
jgi:xanthine dehydrogenase YagS FAD-binding subunit